MNPNVVSFDQWQAACIEDTPLDEMVDCPDCDGTGEVLDECSCCGHEKEETCIACDGNGCNEFGNLCGNDQKKVFNKTNYIKQAIKDITALADWTSTDRNFLLIEAGFTIYNHAKSKREIITIQE